MSHGQFLHLNQFSLIGASSSNSFKGAMEGKRTSGQEVANTQQLPSSQDLQLHIQCNNSCRIAQFQKIIVLLLLTAFVVQLSDILGERVAWPTSIFLFFLVPLKFLKILFVKRSTFLALVQFGSFQISFGEQTIKAFPRTEKKCYLFLQFHTQ